MIIFIIVLITDTCNTFFFRTPLSSPSTPASS